MSCTSQHSTARRRAACRLRTRRRGQPTAPAAHPPAATCCSCDDPAVLSVPPLFQHAYLTSPNPPLPSTRPHSNCASRSRGKPQSTAGAFFAASTSHMSIRGMAANYQAMSSAVLPPACRGCAPCGASPEGGQWSYREFRFTVLDLKQHRNLEQEAKNWPDGGCYGVLGWRVPFPPPPAPSRRLLNSLNTRDI